MQPHLGFLHLPITNALCLLVSVSYKGTVSINWHNLLQHFKDNYPPTLPVSYILGL